MLIEERCQQNKRREIREKNIFIRKPKEKKCLYKIRLSDLRGYHRYTILV
jgi:hypothetical protein